MKKDYHPLDDLFRESLKDLRVTPTQTAKVRFVEQAVNMGGKSGPGFWRWFTTVVVTVVITSAVLLYFLLPGSQTPVTPEKKAVVAVASKNTQTPSQTSVTNNLNVSKPLETKQVQPISTPAEVSKNTSATVADSRINQAKAGSSLHVSKAEAQPNQKEKAISAKQRINNAGITPQEKQNELVETINNSTPVSKSAAVENVQPVQNETEPAETPSAKKSLENSTPADPGTAEPQPAWQSNQTDAKQSTGRSLPKNDLKKGVFETNINYSADWSFKNSSGDLVNSLGLEGRMHYGRFFFTLGGELSRMRDENNCQAQYNDYLGKYQKLDSVTFAWDQKHYHLVPSYYTSESIVWDSVVKTDYYQVSKKYTLLRIPFMVGYDLIRNEHFLFALKLGAASAFCIDSKKVGEDYSFGLNKSLGISQEADAYAKTNFYLLGEMEASYLLTRRLSLNLVPHFEYLLNPADAANKSFDNQFIPGIKASIRYKF